MQPSTYLSGSSSQGLGPTTSPPLTGICVWSVSVPGTIIFGPPGFMSVLPRSPFTKDFHVQWPGCTLHKDAPRANECALKSRPHCSPSPAPTELPTSIRGFLFPVTTETPYDLAQVLLSPQLSTEVGPWWRQRDPRLPQLGHVARGWAGILSSGLTLDLREQTGLALRGRCRALVCPAGAWECREGDTSAGKAGKLWWGEASEEAPCYSGALCPGAHPPTRTPPCCVGKRTPKTSPQT